MKYALLIYTKPGSHEALAPDEYAQVRQAYMDLVEEPGHVGGAQLQPPSTATTVRMSDGEVLTSDGPFADTKEIFGGYYVFEADNLDRALELAARVPAVRLGGSVEVRPIVEIEAPVG
jgi:hypothetical protein